MTKLGMVIDLDACMGCRACMEACKIENNTGERMFWMHVFRFEEGEYPKSRISFMPRPCQHCDRAACVKVCPVGARFKREDGFVLTDSERCIGCRYCEVACPYGVNYFNWRSPTKGQYLDWHDPALGAVTGGIVPGYRNLDHDKEYNGRVVAGSGHAKGVVEKCTWCVHRIDKGLEPACAANCPMEAILFGDLDDPDSKVSKILARKKSFQWNDVLDTHPRVHYVGGTQPGEETRSIEPVNGRL